jgi:hypothetical protein
MNIDDIAHIDTSFLHLRHPATDELLFTGAGKPMGIELCSTEAEDYKRVERKFTNQTLKSGNKKLTAEKLENRSLELLAAASLSWSLEGKDGPIKFSKEAAMTVYAERPWIKKQVTEHLYEESNFLGSALAA